MAETEIKKVLNIQTDKAVRSVKSLQKEIKDLKSQLLSLDNTSEEYSKTLAEVADKTFELRDLNEEIRYSANDLGEKISVVSKTLSSTTQIFGGLKGAMQLVGLETDNLDKAMADMISIMSIVNGLNGIDGLIKNIGRLSIQFSGSIKAVKGFIGALSGVKKALLSTGIGAFVVLVGTLIAQWDKIKELLGGKNNQKFGKYLEDINNNFDEGENIKIKNKEKAFNSYIKAIRNGVKTLDDLKKAEEKYNEQLKAIDITPFTLKINRLNDSLEALSDIINVLWEKRSSKFSLPDFKTSAEAIEYYNKELQNIPMRILENIGAAEIGENESKYYQDLKEKKEIVRFQIESLKLQEELIKTEEEYNKIKLSYETAEDIKFLSNLKNYINELDNFGKSEVEILDKNYQERKNLFEKNNIDTTLLTKKYLKERYDLLYGERDKENAENLKALRKRISDLKEAQKSEIQIINETYNKDIENAKRLISNKKELNDTLYELEKEYRGKVNNLRQNEWEQLNEEANAIVDEMVAASESVYNEWQSIIEKTQTDLQKNIKKTALQYDVDELNRPKEKNTLKEQEAQSAAQYEKQKAINQLELNAINERIKGLQDALDNETIIDDQRIALREDLNNALQEKAEQEYAIEKQNADRIAQVYDEKKEKFKQYYQGITTAFSSLGSTITQVGQMQKEAAKDDEKRQEDAKAVMRTGIIIQTLGSAAAAAYQGWQMQPAPLGAIMAALFTAQAIATGVAQLQSLDNETLNSTSTSASVTPNLNYAENLPSGYYRNLLGDKETEELNKNTRVYVVESDITETQNRVDVVQNNSTF